MHDIAYLCWKCC